MNLDSLGLATGIGPDADYTAAVTTFEELSYLSVEHRTAIVRAFYLHESVSDTAQRRGIPKDEVKSSLHAAAHALRLAIRERGATQ